VYKNPSRSCQSQPIYELSPYIKDVFDTPIRKKEQAFLKKGKFLRQKSNRPFCKKGCVFFLKTGGIFYVSQGSDQNVTAVRYEKSLCPIRKMHVYNLKTAFFGHPESDVLIADRTI